MIAQAIKTESGLEVDSSAASASADALSVFGLQRGEVLRDIAAGIAKGSILFRRELFDEVGANTVNVGRCRLDQRGDPGFGEHGQSTAVVACAAVSAYIVQFFEPINLMCQPTSRRLCLLREFAHPDAVFRCLG